MKKEIDVKQFLCNLTFVLESCERYCERRQSSTYRVQRMNAVFCSRPHTHTHFFIHADKTAHNNISNSGTTNSHPAHVVSVTTVCPLARRVLSVLFVLFLFPTGQIQESHLQLLLRNKSPPRCATGDQKGPRHPHLVLRSAIVMEVVP